MANKRNADDEMALATLIREIVDVPEGSPCFLCATTAAQECIWTEIQTDILQAGKNAIELN